MSKVPAKNVSKHVVNRGPAKMPAPMSAMLPPDNSVQAQVGSQNASPTSPLSSPDPMTANYK